MNLRDPMAPSGVGGGAGTGPLAVVTITTGELERSAELYRGLLGLGGERQAFAGHSGAALAERWGVVPGLREWGFIELTDPAFPDAVRLRLLPTSPDAPSRRPERETRFAGGLGIGVPTRDLQRINARMAAAGIESSVGVISMAFPRDDGTSYEVGEAHYLMPDGVMLLGVDRGDLAQIGPIDAKRGHGGIAYSSIVTTDCARLAVLLGEVLGLERRRACVLEAGGPQDGMRLPPGTQVQFEQWFAAGTTSNYLVVMEFAGVGLPAPTVTGGERGLSRWTFATNDLDRCLSAARRVGVDVVDKAAEFALPGPLAQRLATIRTADGLMIELAETA